MLRLSWGFDNNTYEIPEGNYVCQLLQNFVLERFQLSPSQLTVFLVIDKEQDLNWKCSAWETDPVWWRTKILYHVETALVFSLNLSQPGQ